MTRIIPALCPAEIFQNPYVQMKILSTSDCEKNKWCPRLIGWRKPTNAGAMIQSHDLSQVLARSSLRRIFG
jgi:hypothetical protein